jgi:hypothetical protein
MTDKQLHILCAGSFAILWAACFLGSAVIALLGIFGLLEYSAWGRVFWTLFAGQVLTQIAARILGRPKP